MKLLVLLSCTIALASAGYPYIYAGLYAQHVPIIDHNGVPVDTPEVQAARANHFAAHHAALHGGYLAVGHHGVVPITADGRPIDTPEVQLATAAHFIAYNQAAVRNADPHAAIHAGPADTPEVAIAKAAHLAAHAEARARSGHYRRKRQIPAIGHNGVPLDTPEVQAAKAAHYAALAQTNRNPQPQYNGQYNPQQGYYNPQQQQPQGQSFHYDGHLGYHLPVIGPQGVPTETPAVQQAKAQHLSSYTRIGAPLPNNFAAPQQYNNYNGAPNYQGNHYGR